MSTNTIAKRNCATTFPPSNFKNLKDGSAMPHLIVEYSQNLATFPEVRALMELNEAVTASPEFPDESELKSRFVLVDSFAIGTAPAQRAFVHAQRHNGLHAAFAVAALTHDDRAAIFLQCRRDQLGGRRRCAIEQHHHR